MAAAGPPPKPLTADKPTADEPAAKKPAADKSTAERRRKADDRKDLAAKTGTDSAPRDDSAPRNQKDRDEDGDLKEALALSDGPEFRAKSVREKSAGERTAGEAAKEGLAHDERRGAVRALRSQEKQEKSRRSEDKKAARVRLAC